MGKQTGSCVWQKGVFSDGWITQDKDGALTWFAQKPVWMDEEKAWNSVNESSWMLLSEPSQTVPLFVNPPVFRTGLAYSRRMQQVGPSSEK